MGEAEADSSSSGGGSSGGGSGGGGSSCGSCGSSSSDAPSATRASLRCGDGSKGFASCYGCRTLEAIRELDSVASQVLGEEGWKSPSELGAMLIEAGADLADEQ